jgi:predicted amidohydrolase YtcJ
MVTLGSRGACMHKPYSDSPISLAHNHSYSDMKVIANKLQLPQLNTHAIGDSANTVILKVYKALG